MKKTFLLQIIIILSMCNFASATYNIQDNMTGDVDAGISLKNISSSYDFAVQTFNPASNYNLSIVSIYILKQTIHNDGFYGYIYGTNGTVGTDSYPNGTLYGTSEFVDSSDVENSYTWVNFSFINGVSINEDINYSIVIHSPESSYSFTWGYNSSNLYYGNGGRHLFDNEWNIWHTFATSDYRFKIYSFEIPTPQPSITYSSPSIPTTSFVNESKTFNVGSDQSGNWTWFIDSILMKSSETGTANATYTNSTALNGTTYNVTAIITNTNGSAQTSWDWTTYMNYVTSNTTYLNGSNSTIVAIFNVSYVSPGTTQWGFNISWTDANQQYDWTYTNGTIIQSLTATSTNQTLEFLQPVKPTGIYYIQKATAITIETFIVPIAAFVTTLFAGAAIVIRRIRRNTGGFSNRRLRRQ